jgi:cytochrome c oxidase subunit 4
MMSDPTGHSEHPAHEFHEHIVPVSTYVAVFVSLLILTALTTGMAWVDMGRWNLVVALAIAVCKALLVVLFFMHVKYNKGLSRIAMIAAIFWLGLLMTFTLADELTRHWEIYPLPWAGTILPMFRHLIF